MNIVDLGLVSSRLSAAIAASVKLIPDGIDRYRVHVPFHFDDGDHLVLFLKKVFENWRFTDEGHTIMRLTYDLDFGDLYKAPRHDILESALSMYQVQESDGELYTITSLESLKDTFFAIIQAILRISNITLLNRERVRSTFYADFHSLVHRVVPGSLLEPKWHEPQLDPEGLYAVDYRINHRPKPILLFALATDERVQTATITLLQFEKWNLDNESIAIFEAQETINRKTLARFTDVCDKQFSNLHGNTDRITSYLDALL